MHFVRQTLDVLPFGIPKKCSKIEIGNIVIPDPKEITLCQLLQKGLAPALIMGHVAEEDLALVPYEEEEDGICLVHRVHLVVPADATMIDAVKDVGRRLVVIVTIAICGTGPEIGVRMIIMVMTDIHTDLTLIQDVEDHVLDPGTAIPDHAPEIVALTIVLNPIAPVLHTGFYNRSPISLIYNLTCLLKVLSMAMGIHPLR